MTKPSHPKIFRFHRYLVRAMTPPVTKNHRHQQPSSSSSKPLKPPNITTTTTATTDNAITLSQQDKFLSKSTHLTRREVLKRRSHNLKQLIRCYRDYYWALTEEIRSEFRDYYWKFGVSPFKDDQENEGTGEVDGINCHDLIKNGNRRCSLASCKFNAMALTSYCHLHILNDPNQQLYKPCDFVIKRCSTAPIVCGKPILRSTTPALCSIHFQKAQKNINRALRQAGLSVSASNKFASKFHVLVAEYVGTIQAKRRAVRRAEECRDKVD